MTLQDERNSGEPQAGPHDARRIRLIERNSAGELVLHLHGAAEPVVGVTLARCFPWTMPESHISVRSGEGREIMFSRQSRG